MTRLFLLLALGCAVPQVLAQEPQAAPVAAPAFDENALKYLLDAMAVYKHHDLFAEERTLDEGRRIVTENEQAFALIEEALRRPFAVSARAYAFAWPNPEEDELRKVLSFTRNVSEMLGLRARVQAANGDVAGAVESCLRAVALGLKVQEEADSIPMQSGLVAEASGLAALSKLAPQMTPTQLKSAARRLAEMEARRSRFVRVWDADSASTLRLGQFILALPHPDGAPAALDPERQKAAMNVLRDILEVDDAVLSGPYARIRGMDFSEPAEDGDGMITPVDARRFDAHLWASALAESERWGRGRVLLKHALAQARLQLCATALAARAYQIENKAAPATLQVLVPGYLPAVPLDPFELQEPLRVRADGGAITIYSVGPDGFDDGGRDVPTPNIKFDTLGDIPAPTEVLKF